MGGLVRPIHVHSLMMKCGFEPTGGWSGVEQFEVRSVQQRVCRDQVTVFGGWVGSGVSMRRFTRHINSSQFSGCPSKGHLLDRPVTGRLNRSICGHPLVSKCRVEPTDHYWG